MTDEEIQKLLTEAFLSEESPPLTDENVNLFLSLPIEEGPPEELERARGGFAARVLRSDYERPQPRVRSGLSFGGWLRSMREGAGLSPKAVAARLKRDESFVLELESSESRPWKFPLDVIARVMVLFRVHINAVRSLALYNLANKTAPSAGISTFVSGDPSSSPVLMNMWLQDLERTLRSIGAKDLIS